jgi:shikimate kinase
MNLYLIGYRCTGKTTVGRRLADVLSRPFVDLDEHVVERTGQSVRAFVERYGWKAFRREETSVLVEAAVAKNRIVATGGGIVLAPPNVELMRRSGRVIWLRAAARTIRSRLRADLGGVTMRPPLTQRGTLEEIEDLLKLRNPFYQKAMDFCLDTDRRSIDEIAHQIRGLYFGPREQNPR